MRRRLQTGARSHRLRRHIVWAGGIHQLLGHGTHRVRNRPESNEIVIRVFDAGVIDGTRSGTVG